MIDCSKFKGRKQSICQGYDKYGRPIAVSRRIVWLKYFGFSDEEIEEHLKINTVKHHTIFYTNNTNSKVRNNNKSIGGCGCSKRRS